MKRDLDLIREILFAVEKHGKGIDDFGLLWMNLEISDRVEDEIIFHVNLLREAGYLKLVVSESDSVGSDDRNPIITRLTWDGYEFLEAARDDKRWNKTKEVAGKVGSFAFEVLKPILVDLAKQAVLSMIPGTTHL